MPTTTSTDTNTMPPLTERANRSAGSFELVVSPLLLALLGHWLDRSVFHTAPWLTVTLTVAGLVGAVTKVVLEYRTKMASLAEERRAGAEAGRLAREPMETPRITHTEEAA